jgi:integrase/recombinase XerD
MTVMPDAGRDVASITLAAGGRVTRSSGVVKWQVLDSCGLVVCAIERFMRDFVACGNSQGSVRSYAFVLHRWWRFLAAIDVSWDRATAADTRDLVLWMLQAPKPRSPNGSVASRPGGINPVTRKRYLDDRYQPRTIRHNNAVLRSFYQYWMDCGEGPLINPVPRDRPNGSRSNAHHNPLDRYRAEGRLRYNPPVPKRAPRAMPDERWDDLFDSLRSDRDRAILSLAISTAARASEILGIRAADVDWGEQLVCVRRKGSGAEQWLPASPDAFVWLRLYLSQIEPLPLDQPVWWTLRRRRQGGQALARLPLTYDALRAVLRRANEQLGANWTMHDLRHTCALRMLRDERLSLRDVQVILGHAHLSTTEIYLEEDELAVIHRVHDYLNGRRAEEIQPPPAITRYDAHDLDVLLGGRQ